jgi:hypothetical protein
MVEHHSLGYRVDFLDLVVDGGEVVQAFVRVSIHERKIRSLREQRTQGVRTFGVKSITDSEVSGTAIPSVTSKKPEGATSAGLENNGVKHDVGLIVEGSHRMFVDKTSNLRVSRHFTGQAHKFEPYIPGNNVAIKVQPRLRVLEEGENRSRVAAWNLLTCRRMGPRNNRCKH